MLLARIAAGAQIGATPLIGTAVLANINLAHANDVGNSSIPVCSPGNYECHTLASLQYIFTGSGNWNVPENWSNNVIPPSTLPADFEIVIDPSGSLECILNIAQTIASGAFITIREGKQLKVAGKVTIQ